MCRQKHALTSSFGTLLEPERIDYKSASAAVSKGKSLEVPPDLTPERLKALLDPVLDFNKRTFMKTGLESLPLTEDPSADLVETGLVFRRLAIERPALVFVVAEPAPEVGAVDALEGGLAEAA